MTDIYNIIAKVNNIISPVYLVGGPVRDNILKRDCTDYDFCTPLTADEVESLVKKAGKHAYTIGKRFGTIGFKLDGDFIEITTFRTESYRNGCRKPDVEFVKDITADLYRRDFTINAIAIKTKDFTLIDPFGGKNDIDNKLIKAVNHNPAIMFKDDPLRLLRAARFVSQLNGFTIEENTLKKGKQVAHKILDVSVERMDVELCKLLISNNPSIGLQAMVDLDILKYVIPDLQLQIGYDQNSCYHSLNLWEHTKLVVENVPKDINIKWAALLHDIAKPHTSVSNSRTGYNNYIQHEVVGARMVSGIASMLKWSNDRKSIVTSLVLNHMKEDSPLKEADDKAKRVDK